MRSNSKLYKQRNKLACMQLEILRKIGLTQGEIRVYSALVKIGKSSTGPIMENSNISSSKVYLILEKLIQKGFVSYIIENNVRKYQMANPKNIIYFIEKKENEIKNIKSEAAELVTHLSSITGTYEKESAQIYKGFAGMRVAFQNLLDELDKGDDFLFFSLSGEEYSSKVKILFDIVNRKRTEKGINSKGIIDIKYKKIFKEITDKRELAEVKFSHLSLPSSISIGKNRILLLLFEENPIVFEIISKRNTEKYKTFFYNLWNNI